mgnify:CR=1 FL=1
MCAVLFNVRENTSHGSKTFTTLAFSKQIQGVFRGNRGFLGSDVEKSPVMNLLLIQLREFFVSYKYLILYVLIIVVSQAPTLNPR